MTNSVMIETSVGKSVRVDVVCRYLRALVNKFFKILPLYEDHEETICEYIRSLQKELIGFQSLITDGYNDDLLMSLVSILEYLHDIISTNKFEIDKHRIKKEVFGAIKVCQKMEQRYICLIEEAQR